MQFKIIGLIAFPIISLAMMVYIFIDNKKKGSDAPFDDSNMIFDTDAISKKIRSFIGNNDERIISVLGIKYVQELLRNVMPSKGFCFLTDKAYYFIGDVYQKMGFIIHWKSNIQHRITADDMKGIKVEKLYSLKFFIFTCYILFRFISRSRMLIGVITEDYSRYAWLFDFAERNEENLLIGVYVLFIVWVGPLISLLGLVYGIANFFLTTRTLISVEFTSQTFSFPIDTLGAEEIKAFYKEAGKAQTLKKGDSQADDGNNGLRSIQIPSSLQGRVKNLSESVSKVQTGNNNKNNPRTVSSSQGKSKVESLTELSKLYEQKMITQEEFERLKKEVLENN
ncbi:MAG: SHOCT domain-containing protein [Lachnospiraceae bacterium]|nr:SHOCT domain-containing protein [Lachnospiraceae bacterium]